jgi:hypothetical protein
MSPARSETHTSRRRFPTRAPERAHPHAPVRPRALFARLLATLCILASPTPAFAQSLVPDATPELQLERLLESAGLDDLLATHLRDRLARAEPAERPALAERLGDLYARMHAAAQTPAARAEIESLGYALLRDVPDSESFSLRLNLAKARYLAAEEVAERHRMRLAQEPERAEALQTLRSVAQTFEEVAGRVQGHIDALERREQRPTRDTNLIELKAQLERAHRDRSLARFYLGWTRYYRALLESQPSLAAAAPQDFGWILNTPGRPAAVDRVAKGTLRYDHVARAALGCAMVASLLGNDAEAERWFDLLQTADAVPEAVKSQIFTRRISVYAAARRWADLERLITDRRILDKAPLSVADARLLAVIVLEAGSDRATAAGREKLLESLAQAAFRDLIERGEIPQIIDLVARFGTTPLGVEGFVAEYVRAVNAYDRAMAAHKSAGLASDAPATDAALVTLFRDASAQLIRAADAPDAEAFAPHRDRARFLAGVAMHFASLYPEAADLLESSFKSATDPGQREESLWLAIASLDRAVEGNRPSLAPRRDRAALLFIEQFPRSERAAVLLLRRAGEGLIPDDQAIRVLLAITPSTPLYVTARRYAARLQYRLWRAAPSDTRAATAFFELAGELSDIDADEAQSTDPTISARAATELVLRERQALDIALTIDPPDRARAQRGLQAIERAVSQWGVELGDAAAELDYRKLQLAILSEDEAAIARAADTLRRHGGRFADAGERLIYRRLHRRWLSSPADADAARLVVGSGQRIIDALPKDAKTLADPGVFGLYESVAQAATVVWNAQGDESFRAIAQSLDERISTAGLATGRVMRRRAELAEASGDLRTALDAWLSLLAGHAAGTEEWFEARYNSLRLLLATDAAAARAALDQHVVLWPELAPPTWLERFTILRARIEASVPAPNLPASDTPSGGPR